MPESCREKLEKAAADFGVSVEQMPRRIAVIMDGNGRWARQKGLPRTAGHRQGAKTVEKIAQHCVDLGIECLFLYSFSI